MLIIKIFHSCLTYMTHKKTAQGYAARAAYGVNIIQPCFREWFKDRLSTRHAGCNTHARKPFWRLS